MSRPDTRQINLGGPFAWRRIPPQSCWLRLVFLYSTPCVLRNARISL